MVDDEELSPRQKYELADAEHRFKKVERSIGQVVAQRLKTIRQRGEEAQELRRVLNSLRFLHYQLKHGLIRRPEHEDVARLFDYIAKKMAVSLAVGADIERLKKDAWEGELEKIYGDDGVAQAPRIRDLVERVHLLNEQLADIGKSEADISHLLTEKEGMELALGLKDASIESLERQLRETSGHVEVLKEHDHVVRHAYVEQFFRALEASHKLRESRRGVRLERLLAAGITIAAGTFGVLWYNASTRPPETSYVAPVPAPKPVAEPVIEYSRGKLYVRFEKETFAGSLRKMVDVLSEIEGRPPAEQLKYWREQARYIEDATK